MRKITLQITAELCAVLGITNSADDAAVGLAIVDAAKKVGTLTTELATEKATITRLQKEITDAATATNAKEIKALLDNAQEKKGITNELRAQLATDYATNPKGLNTLLEGMGAYMSVVDAIEKVNTIDLSKYTGKSWDALMEGGLIEAFKKESPAGYKKLYKETFPGEEPA